MTEGVLETEDGLGEDDQGAVRDADLNHVSELVAGVSHGREGRGVVLIVPDQRVGEESVPGDYSCEHRDWPEEDGDRASVQNVRGVEGVLEVDCEHHVVCGGPEVRERLDWGGGCSAIIKHLYKIVVCYGHRASGLSAGVCGEGDGGSPGFNIVDRVGGCGACVR